MYRCIKFKHSVLPGMPILNRYAQQLHIASKMLLRRKLSETTSASENPPSMNQNGSIDFLGIESDDGVITLNSCTNPTPEIVEKPLKPRKKEMFYSTSYGVVRYDADNKIKRHGQYGNKIEFEFPHRSDNNTIVSKNLQNLTVKSTSTSTITNDSAGINENTELHMNQINPNDHSYIDDFYFGNISEIENTNRNNNTQESPNELNFLDKSYFSSLTDSEIFNTSQNMIIEEDKKDISTQRECFENKSEDANQSQLHELNLVDKIYFENLAVSKKSINSDIEDFSKERLQNIGPTSDYHLKETLEVTVDKSISHRVNDDIKGDNIFLTGKINDISMEYTSDDQLDMLSDIRYQKTQTKTVNSNSQSLNEPTVYKNIEIPKSSAKKVRDKLISEKIQQKRGNIDSSVKAIESSAKRNIFKYPSINSKESTVAEPLAQENISTAHDFVSKLRKEQEIPQPTIRTEKDLIKIKFDSKGFRILKDQVPNLSYFTRDEILSLLVKNIVYSDNDLLVLNKPYGLVVHESKTTKEPCLSTFLDDLAKETDKNSNSSKLFTVHRIDKETTGCLLLARTETMAQQLKALFAQRKIIKKYWIITTRVPDPPEGIIDIPITEGSIHDKRRMVLNPKLPNNMEYKNHAKGGKEAITAYKVLSESGNAALVEVMPKTGIKHQIRVHFGFGLSCPILGDHKYSHLDKFVPQVLQNDILQKLHVRQTKVRHIPMHIHARTVIIPKYFEERDLVVNIPIPEHMKLNLKMLKFRKKEMSSRMYS